MIELIGVHKSFGEQQVLRGVDLTVAEGTTCVLLGVSGSGKTVLMKHIDGLLRPDAGKVCVDGETLNQLSAREMEAVRRKLGILFQAGALFDSLTVFDNVAFPLRERAHLPEEEVARQVRHTLALVGLQGAESLYPGELSGGMQKRVAFSRAVVLQPRVLLYDDPTAGLDPLTTESVIDVIVTGKKRVGATSFIVTPDVSMAFHVGDRLAFLHEGRIVEHSPPEEFRQCRHPAVKAFLQDWLQREALRHPRGDTRLPP
ncbi:ABC transporter ATP-binding protein [Hyalangium versicolor]|uniref:ABC transporter ATP-binding protein n=1 Tax=Hyalangium versicolor TaxID=2861190 RepID=UPI001CCDE7A7|nr:ATP-binding cassette domain-containing protein [Hyalangium versicolor]